MTCLSKAIKFSFLAGILHAAPGHKKGKGGKLRNLIFLAPTAVQNTLASEQQYYHDIRVKHAQSQDHLERLLHSPDNMLASFEDFMTRRYGKVCEIEKVKLDIFQPDSKDTVMESEIVPGKVCKNFKLSESNNIEMHQNKFKNFQDNVGKAYLRNLKSDQKVYHGITSVMDLSKEEFYGLLGYKASEIDNGMSMVKKIAHAKELLGEEAFNTELGGDLEGKKGSKDWRKDGVITPVKDQGQCGSCWAFSTVESIESAAILAGKSDPKNPFIGAPAQLVDCDKKSGDMGCNGGLPANAFKYLKNHALEEESDYPYQPLDEKCTVKKGKGEFEVTKTKQLSIFGIGESRMKNYVLKHGPLSIGVAANHDWQTYKGGLMDNDICPDVSPNHAVQAVAVNTEADEPYWTIRNSWADTWGEDGFIRITYGKNTCNIAYMGMYVHVKKVADEATVVV